MLTRHAVRRAAAEARRGAVVGGLAVPLLGLVAAGAARPAPAGPQRGVSSQVRMAEEPALHAIGLPAAWRVSRGQSVTVAVLDTGADPGAADLTGSVITGPDYTVGADPAGYHPPHLHGTYIASLIAGHGSGPGRADGVIGVAPAAKVLSVRVLLDDSEPGLEVYNSSPRFSDAVGRGVRYAVSHGAQVINMSLGSDTPTRGLRAAIADAISHGVVVVAAAGNSGSGGTGFTPFSYPAAYPGVVAVAAVGTRGGRAGFSDRNASVVLSAPGVNVVGAGPNGNYLQASGTSPASAFVAGVAVLIRSAYPKLSPALVEQALISSARFQPSDGYSPDIGFGEVDAQTALQAAARLAGHKPAAGESPQARAVAAEPGPIQVVHRDTSKIAEFGGLSAAGAAGFLAALVAMVLVARRAVRDRRAGRLPGPDAAVPAAVVPGTAVPGGAAGSMFGGPAPDGPAAQYQPPAWRLEPGLRYPGYPGGAGDGYPGRDAGPAAGEPGAPPAGHPGPPAEYPASGWTYPPRADSYRQPPAGQPSQPPPAEQQGAFTGYPVPGEAYPQPPAGYSEPAAEPPAPGYPGPASGYPEPASGYPEPASGYPEPAAGYPEEPAPGYPVPEPSFAEPPPGYREPAGDDPAAAPGDSWPAPAYPEPVPGHPEVTPGEQAPVPGGPGFAPEDPGLAPGDAGPAPDDPVSWFAGTPAGQEPARDYPPPGPGRQEPAAGYPEAAPGYQEPGVGYPAPGAGYRDPAAGQREPAIDHPQVPADYPEPAGDYPAPALDHAEPAGAYPGPPVTDQPAPAADYPGGFGDYREPAGGQELAGDYQEAPGGQEPAGDFWEPAAARGQAPDYREPPASQSEPSADPPAWPPPPDDSEPPTEDLGPPIR